MIKSNSIKPAIPFFVLHFRLWTGHMQAVNITILVESFPWLQKQVKPLLSSDSVLILQM